MIYEVVSSILTVVTGITGLVAVGLLVGIVLRLFERKSQ